MLKGNPPIAVTLRRSARARRLTLRVGQADGRVTLTLPHRLPEREALAFLASREGWLRARVDEVGAPQLVAPGTMLPLEGREVPVRRGEGRRTRLDDGGLWLPEGPAAARIEAFVKLAARDRLAAAADRHAAALGHPYRRLTLRDTRSRWGSCTAAGDLMFNWRLVMAPPEVLDYVAAHEVAHLAEMNHGPAFWKVVAQLFPAHAGARAWLRAEGARLHRIRFGD